MFNQAVAGLPPSTDHDPLFRTARQPRVRAIEEISRLRTLRSHIRVERLIELSAGTLIAFF
jgi:hypothetical protein